MVLLAQWYRAGRDRGPSKADIASCVRELHERTNNAKLNHLIGVPTILIIVDICVLLEFKYLGLSK